MKNILIGLSFLLLGIGIGYFLLGRNVLSQFNQSLPKIAPPSPQVSSFEECAALGNPIMESYPPRCSTNGIVFTQNIGNELELRDVIVSENPRPNQVVKSPLEVRGRARGQWFFEAQFVAKLLDDEGNVLSLVPVTAEGEWMTVNFVPYSGELKFNTSATKKGELILEKANPSGLPENDQQLVIPLRFE